MAKGMTQTLYHRLEKYWPIRWLFFIIGLCILWGVIVVAAAFMALVLEGPQAAWLVLSTFTVG